MALEYVEKHGIIEHIWRCLCAMLELFLIAVEKLVDEPKILIALVVISFILVKFINYRGQYVFSRVYVEESLSKTMKEQMHQMQWMVLPISVLTELLVNISVYLYGDEKSVRLSFLVYYVPMLALTIYLRIRKLHNTRGDSYLKCAIWLLPGISCHVLFLSFLAFSNKDAWILGLIAILSVIVPPIFDVGILIVVSPKDIKMVSVELVNSEKYDIKHRDLIEIKDDAYIRIRDKNGRIEKTIIVKKENISKKTIYTIKPDLELVKGRR